MLVAILEGLLFDCAVHGDHALLAGGGRVPHPFHLKEGGVLHEELTDHIEDPLFGPTALDVPSAPENSPQEVLHALAEPEAQIHDLEVAWTDLSVPILTVEIAKAVFIWIKMTIEAGNRGEFADLQPESSQLGETI